jgi:primase-polymerase (primpol)-like protein
MPAELKALQIWVAWRYVWDGQRWRKVPYIPILDKQIKAKSIDSRTWRCHDEAKSVYHTLVFVPRE